MFRQRNAILIEPPVKRYFNGNSLVGRWWSILVAFWSSRPSSTKKTLSELGPLWQTFWIRAWLGSCLCCMLTTNAHTSMHIHAVLSAPLLFTIKKYDNHSFSHTRSGFPLFNPCEKILSHKPMHTRLSDPYVRLLSENAVPYRFPCEISLTNTR